MEGAVNGEGEKGGQPPPSPLTGCYLLIVIGEPRSTQHKDIILQRIAKGLLSWDVNECLVDLEKELAVITEQALEGEEARYGERLIQFASENLVTEILIHPVVSTLQQCMRNLLSSFTRHRHIIHSGYTFAANGSWALQDGTFSLADFSEAFQEIDVQRVIRAYENGIGVDLHCSPEGDWTRLPKEPFAKACKVRINPTDVLNSGSPAITGFVNYLDPYVVPTTLECLLESTDVVGNIRFSRPTLYVFPGGQGDAALFGISGFNMLLDGGYARKACFWDFVRHLDRLDAVLMTRLNNSNVGGISSVLRRKRQDALYPQIGHFFCNLQERKALLSPDGDKDKDPLLLNLLEEGQEIISNLRHLSLNPQVCYRDSEPINLYHKVGHGTLDMYVLSPARDSREVKEFLQKWNQSDQKLFANAKSSREFTFPIQNLVSIAALLVWQPANPNDTITRILIPGSCPQKKIFEGLERLKHLEFLKHPVCTEKSLMPVSVPKKTVRESIIEKVIPTKEKVVVEKKENKLIEDGIIANGDVVKEKIVKKSDSTESERSTRVKKVDETKINENGEKPEKPKIRQKPPKGRSESQQRKKLLEKKISPTTPKKTEADDVKEKDVKKPTKPSPISTPAKSTKDATNRRVIESKIKKELPATKPLPPVPKEEPKPKFERKPISRRPKAMKAPISPVKKLVNGVQKPDSISRRGKLDKEGTTDSSTVSTPSADQDSILKKDISKLTPEEIQQLKAQELADLKEEQEAVKEIEAVFRKGETKKVDDPNIRVVKDVSIDEKFEKDEYLIIEKEEIEHDSLDDRDGKEGEMQKLARDSEESEKQRKLSDEDILKKDVIQEIVEKAEEVIQAKEEPAAVSKGHSPEEKSTDKKEVEEEKDVVESQPEEKVSVIKSGDTTTAPTLPEDERIPLDEIKEDSGAVIEEKYVKEETKEKELPIIQLPPKTFETVGKLPTVAGIRLDKQTHIRDIVKTPDEVADLPVHEEADLEYIKTETKTNEVVEDKERKVGASDKEHLKEVEPEKDKDDVAQDIKEKRAIVREELKTLTDTVLQNELTLENDILEKSVSKLDDKEKTEGDKDVLEKAEVETKEKEVTDDAKLHPTKKSPDLKEVKEPITSELGLKAEEEIMAVKDEVLTKDKDLDLDKEVAKETVIVDKGKPEKTTPEDKAKSKSPSPIKEEPTPIKVERKESKDLDAAELGAKSTEIDAVKRPKPKTPSPTEDKLGHQETEKETEKLEKSKSPSPTKGEPTLSEKPITKSKSPSPTREVPIESELEKTAKDLSPAPVDKDTPKSKSSSPTGGKLDQLDKLEPKLSTEIQDGIKTKSPSPIEEAPMEKQGAPKEFKDLSPSKIKSEPKKSVDLDIKHDIKEEIKSKTPSPTLEDRKLSKDLGLSELDVDKEPRKSVDLDEKQVAKDIKSKTPSPTPEDRKLSKDLGLSELDVDKEPRKSVDLDTQQDIKKEIKNKTPSPTPEDRKLSKDLGLSKLDVDKEPRKSVDLDEKQVAKDIKSKTPSPTPEDRKLSKDLGLSKLNVDKEPRKSVDLDEKQVAKGIKSKTPSPTPEDRKLSKDLGLSKLDVEKEPRKSVDLDEKQVAKDIKSKTPSPTPEDRKLSKDLGLSKLNVDKEPRKSVDLDEKQVAKDIKSKTPSPTPADRKLSKDLGLSELDVDKEPRKSVDIDTQQDIKKELKSKTPSPTPEDRKLSKDLGLGELNVDKEPRKSVDLDEKQVAKDIKSKTPSPTPADRKLSKDLGLSELDMDKGPRKSVDLDTQQDIKKELKSKTPSPTPEDRKLSKDLGLGELNVDKKPRKSVDLDEKQVAKDIKSKTPSPTPADRKLSKDLGQLDIGHKEPRKSVDLDTKQDIKEEIKSKTPSPTPEDRKLSKDLGLSEINVIHQEPRKSVDLDKKQDTEEKLKSKTPSPTPEGRKLSKDLGLSKLDVDKEPRKSVDLDTKHDIKDEFKSKSPSPITEKRKLSKDLGPSGISVVDQEPRKSVDLDKKQDTKQELKSKTPSPTPEDRKLSKDLGLSVLDKEPRKSVDSGAKQDAEAVKSKTPSPTPKDRKPSKDLGHSEISGVHQEPRKSLDLDTKQDVAEDIKSKSPSPTLKDRKLSKDLVLTEADITHEEPRRSVDLGTKQEIKETTKSRTPSPTPEDRKLSKDLGVSVKDVAQQEPRKSVELATEQDFKEVKSKIPSPTPDGRKLSEDLGLSKVDLEHERSEDITKKSVHDIPDKLDGVEHDIMQVKEKRSASKISSPTEESAVKSKSSSPTKALFDELKDVKDLEPKEDEPKLSLKSKSPSPTKEPATPTKDTLTEQFDETKDIKSKTPSPTKGSLIQTEEEEKMKKPSLGKLDVEPKDVKEITDEIKSPSPTKEQEIKSKSPSPTKETVTHEVDKDSKVLTPKLDEEVKDSLHHVQEDTKAVQDKSSHPTKEKVADAVEDATHKEERKESKDLVPSTLDIKPKSQEELDEKEDKLGSKTPSPTKEALTPKEEKEPKDVIPEKLGVELKEHEYETKEEPIEIKSPSPAGKLEIKGTKEAIPSELKIKPADMQEDIHDKLKTRSPTKDLPDHQKEEKDSEKLKTSETKEVHVKGKSPSPTDEKIDDDIKDTKSTTPSPTKETITHEEKPTDTLAVIPGKMDVEDDKIEKEAVTIKSKSPSPTKDTTEDALKAPKEASLIKAEIKLKDEPAKSEEFKSKSPSPTKKEIDSSKDVKSKSPSPTEEIPTKFKDLPPSTLDIEPTKIEATLSEKSKTPSPDKGKIDETAEPKDLVKKLSPSETELEPEPAGVKLAEEHGVQEIAKPETSLTTEEPPIQKGKEVKTISDSPSKLESEPRKSVDLHQKQDIQLGIKSKSPSPPPEGRKSSKDLVPEHKQPETKTIISKSPSPTDENLEDLKTHVVQEEIRSKTPSPTQHVASKEHVDPKDLKDEVESKTPSPIKETDHGKTFSPELKEQTDSAKVGTPTTLEQTKEVEEEKVKSRSISPTRDVKSKSSSPTKDLEAQKEEISTKLEDIGKDIDSSKPPTEEVKTATADKPLHVTRDARSTQIQGEPKTLGESHVKDAKEETKSKTPSPEPKSMSPSPTGERKIESQEKHVEAKLDSKPDLVEKRPYDVFEDSKELDKTEVVVIKETELPSVESIKTEIDKIDKDFIKAGKDAKEELIMIEDRLQKLKQDTKFTESDVKVVDVKSEDSSPIQERLSDVDVGLGDKITITEKDAKDTGVDAKVSKESIEKELLAAEVKGEGIKQKDDASPKEEIKTETTQKKSPEKELEASIKGEKVDKLDTKAIEKLPDGKPEDQTEKKVMSPEKEMVKPGDKVDTKAKKESEDEVVVKSEEKRTKSPIQEIIDTIDQLEKTEKELKEKEHETKDDKRPKLEEVQKTKLATEVESPKAEKQEIKEKDKVHTKLDTEEEKVEQPIEKATTGTAAKLQDDAKTKSEKLDKDDTDESKAVIKDEPDVKESVGDKKDQSGALKKDDAPQEVTDEKSLAEEIKDAKARVEEKKDIVGDSISLQDRVDKPQDEAAKVKSEVEDTSKSPQVEIDTKPDESKEGTLIPEQIRKKPSISIDDFSEELEEIHKKIKDDKIIDKVELGRKSPKEREEDVIKIVATVAEVLKSDAPLEEFEGKLPISTMGSYTSPYTTELRETHITTMDSPTVESKVIKSDSIHTIEEEPHSILNQFLEEEKKESLKHLDDIDDKRSALIKQSQELMMATSKIISDIKSAKPEDKLQDEDAGTVHRMLVTASSEDGGEETEICPPGSITFSKSSESSGRSSPDQSQKQSQKSSLMETISDSLSTVKHVLDMTSERDSGIDDAKSETELDKSRTSPELAKEGPRKVGEASGKSSPDKDVSDISESKETSSYDDLKRFDDTSKKDSGLSDSERGSEEFERKGSVIEAIEETIIAGLTKTTDFTKSLFSDKEKQHPDVERDEKEITEKIKDTSSLKDEVEDKKTTIQEKDTTSTDKITDDLAETKVEKPPVKISESGSVKSEVDKIETLDKDVKDVVDKTDKQPQEAKEIVGDALQKMDETVRIKRSAVEMEIKNVIDAAGDLQDNLTETATKIVDDSKDGQETLKEIKEQLPKDKAKETKAEIDHATEIVNDTLDKMEEDIKIKTSAVQLEMKSIDDTKKLVEEKLEDATDQILKSVEDKTKEIKTDVDLTKKAFTDLSDTIMDKKTTFEESLDKIKKIEEAFKDDVKDTQDKVGDISKEAEDKISELTSDASQKGKDAIETTTEEMKKDIEDAKHKIDDLAKKAGEEVAEVKGGILSSFGAFLDKAGDMFKSAEESTKDTIDKASKDIEVLKHDTKEELEQLKDVSDQTKQSIEKEITEVEKGVKDAIEDVKEKQEEIELALHGDISKSIKDPDTEKIESKGIFGTLLEKAGDIFKATGDAIQDASDQVVKDAGDMTEQASKDLSDIKDGLIQDVSKSLEKAEDILNLKKDQLKDEFAHSKEVVSKQLESIEKAAQEKKEEVAGGLAKAEDELKSKTGQLKEDAVSIQKVIGEKLETLGKEAQEKKKDVTKGAEDILKFTKEELKEDVTDAKDFMNKKLELVGTEVEKKKEEIFSDLDKTKDELKTTKEIIKEDAIQAKEIVDVTLKELEKEVQEKKEELKKDVTHATEVVADKVEAVERGLHEKKEQLEEDIVQAKDVVSKQLETIGKGVQDKKEELKKDITHAKEVVGETLHEIEKDVQHKKDEVTSDFKETIDVLKSAKEHIKEDATRIKEVMGEKVETAVHETKEKLSGSLKEAKTAGDDLAKKVDDAAVKAATEIKSGLEKLEKGIEAEKSSIEDGIHKVKTAAKEEIDMVTKKISDDKQSVVDSTEKEIKEKEDTMAKALIEAESKIDLTIDESKKGLEESLEKISAVQQASLESVEDAMEHLKDLTEDVKIKISTSKDAAADKLETSVTQLEQETKTKIDEATKHTEQKVEQAKGGIMGAVGSFLGKAGDLFKSSPDSTKEEKGHIEEIGGALKSKKEELEAEAEHAKSTVAESIETVIEDIKKEKHDIQELSEGELKIAPEKTESVKTTIKETSDETVESKTESTLDSKEKSEREAAKEFLAESLSTKPEPKSEVAKEVSFKETTAKKVEAPDSKRTKRSVEDINITDEAAKELINRYCEDPCEVQKPSKETEAVLKSLEVCSYKPVCEPECVKVCVERKYSDVSAEDFQKISPDQYDDALSSLVEKEKKIDGKTEEKPTKDAEDKPKSEGFAGLVGETPSPKDTPEDTVIVCISEKPAELTTVTTTSATPSSGKEESATVQIITTTITTDTIIPGDKLLSEREKMDEKKQAEELDATFDALEDMIETVPFKSTPSKAGKVLEESAKDLEQTFEVVGDMSRSVVFEKCDRKDSLPVTEKLIEKSAQDVSETFENVNEMSKSLVFDKCSSDKTESEKELFDEKADKIDKKGEVVRTTYEILPDNKSSEQTIDSTKSSVFEKCERETMEKGSGKSCIVRESRIIISGSSLPPSHDIIQQLKYVDNNLIEDEFTLSTPESQGKKVSISEVDITVPKSDMCPKEVSSRLLETERMSVEKYEQKTEIKEKSSSDTTVSIRKTISVSIAGPSTTSTVKSIGDGEKQKETLLQEKHIPGAVTPPTVPVSPNLQEGTTDISKSQESVRVDSDEDDRLSITSEAAHSRESSYYDFDAYVDGKRVDPMSMSFYGALPSGEVEPSYLYEITKAKFSSISTEDSDVQIESKKDEGDVMSSSCIGELPGDEKTEGSSGQKEDGQEKKDPIGSWGKPLGLPPTPRSHLFEITKAKYTSPEVSGESRDTPYRFDMMTASVYGDLPTEDSEKAQDPIKSWGKPLGLPSPAPPNDNKGTPKKERKLPPNVTAKNKLNDDKRRADSPSKHNKNKKVTPIYLDLSYVPHHGNSYYAYVDFFKRVRARYYVFSGIEPSREVYNALLEAKQTWEDKELEVTIIPTYDTDTLGYWVADNEELLAKYKIDLSPSASRCTINLQDHETSCSAYRLEF